MSTPPGAIDSRTGSFAPAGRVEKMPAAGQASATRAIIATAARKGFSVSRSR
ncbi:MAG: hypothetical protein OXQ26_05395 [bacterium]|nr:hypothetical protein [bacterium]